MFFFFIVIIILVFPGMVVKSEPFSIAAGLDYLTLCLKKILYDIAVLCLYRYILRLFLRVDETLKLISQSLFSYLLLHSC